MEQAPFQGGNLQAIQVNEQGQLIHATEQDQLIVKPHTPSGKHPTQTPEQPDRLTDDQLIHYHITEALREDRPIDHATVRCIASQLHGGQVSALYALASTGAVIDGLRSELERWRRDETPAEVEPWLDALDEYLSDRDDGSPIDGWQQLWPVQPERDDDEPDGGEGERPPFGTPGCAIGRSAVSAGIEHLGDSEQAAKSPGGQLSQDEITATEHSEDSGPVADLTERAEAQDREDLVHRISAAGVTNARQRGNHCDHQRYTPALSKR